MKRILVPVDFSSHTETSCRYALEIGKVTGAELIIFHSFFDQFYYSDGGLATGFESGILMTDEIILDFYKQKEASLRQLVSTLNERQKNEDERKVQITARMESGNPEIQIIHTIQVLSPDLIIMGSGGMGKKGLLAGSVARRIIDHTNIPVIAVPDNEKEPSIRKIAYMTTFDLADIGIIKQIDGMLAGFNAEYYCLHITDKSPDPESRIKMEELCRGLNEANLKDRVTAHVETSQNHKEVLKHFMATYHTDLIAFIPHKRNIFQNLFYQGITKDDLFQTQVPVMAVKPVNV